MIEKVSDFNGFEIIFHEEHKPGVFKIWIKRDLKEHTKSMLVFCEKELIPKDIDAHNKYWRPLPKE